MDNPNPFLDEKLMSREEYRQCLKEHVKIVLERDWNFKILKALGKGTFGDVFSGTSPDYAGKVAVKITRSDETWEKEKCDCRNLNHPNVMPLLQVISLKQADIFVMPQLSEDLYHILGEIRSVPCGLARVKSWLKDVLLAIDYLHQRQLCHLDIKSDNVMIDFNDRAVLCDFTFLNDTTAPTTRYGIPLIYRPPEAWEILGCRVAADGAKLDIWCFGMLGFSVLSGHVILRKLRQTRSWGEDIYPFLLYGLKAPQFHALMTKAFPASSISDEEVAKTLNFLQTILRDRAEDRPCATELLKHGFLANERQTNPGDAEIPKDFTRDVIASLTSEVNDIRNVKNPEVVLGKEITGHPESPGIYESADDFTRDVIASLTSEVNDVRNVKNPEVVLGKEITGHPESPGISESAEDAVMKKRKSRRKRVTGWFRRTWTRLWIRGSNTADD